MMIDYNKLVYKDKQHAFASGRINTYKELLNDYEEFMSEELKSVISKKLASLGVEKDECLKEMYAAKHGEEVSKSFA